MDFTKALMMVLDEAESSALLSRNEDLLDACIVVEQFIKYLPDSFVKDATPNKMKLISYTHFYDDEEKMYDFDRLTKEDFLKSYSYITEREYNLTRRRQKEGDSYYEL